MTKKTQAIIASGGIGTRLGGSQIKPLVELAGRPLIAHTLEVFASSPMISGIICVAPASYQDEFRKILDAGKWNDRVKLVPGGATRTASVAAGLKALDRDCEYVVIHDGARPLVTRTLIEQTILAAYQEGAVIAAVPAKATIKKVKVNTNLVVETPDRKTLWEVQTPQVFRKDVILKAHQTVRNIEATDDAYLVERMGLPVKVVRGSYTNIKVTTPEDLIIAEALLAAGTASPRPQGRRAKA